MPPRSCLHCGAAVTTSQSTCPNCGTLFSSVWPPPLAGTLVQGPARPKLLTGCVWADFLVGAGGQYLLHLVTARLLTLGLPDPGKQEAEIIAPVMLGGIELLSASIFGAVAYSVLRRVYPAVARGGGYATYALLLVLLGAFFTCREVMY